MLFPGKTYVRTILKECNTSVFSGIFLLLKDIKYPKMDTNATLGHYCKIS